MCLNSLIELNSERRDDPQGPTQTNSFARRLKRCCVYAHVCTSMCVCVRSPPVDEMDNVLKAEVKLDAQMWNWKRGGMTQK